MTLKELVEKHGFNITVSCGRPSFPPFKINREDPLDSDCYNILYQDGKAGSVLKECKSCSDYDLV
jgi:hypothetical protein